MHILMHVLTQRAQITSPLIDKCKCSKLVFNKLARCVRGLVLVTILAQVWLRWLVIIGYPKCFLNNITICVLPEIGPPAPPSNILNLLWLLSQA